MRKLLMILLSCFLCSGVLSGSVIAENLPATVCFTPGGDCTDQVVKELNAAKTDVLVQAYNFTSAPIAKAITDAYKRGVKVSVILDKSQKSVQYSAASFLSNAGVPVKIDAKHAIAHNKIIIIDEGTIITGSFNFTKAAQEKNAENLLIIKDKELAGKYIKNWNEHDAHAEVYQGR